jgi:hypothetical protein
MNFFDDVDRIQVISLLVVGQTDVIHHRNHIYD